MPHRRTTFSKFIIGSLRRAERDPELAAPLNDVMTACKLIAAAVSRGAAEPADLPGSPPPDDRPLGRIADEIMLSTCEFGGQLRGILSGDMEQPYAIPDSYPRGRYLLLFEPLDGAPNIDVNMPVGTIFSVLQSPDGVTTDPVAADFLRPGMSQVAAGYALYGPVSMLAVTLGEGVHGFTLEREIGAYALTHPHMRIPAVTREFAIDAANARFWEPPVRRYVEACTAGLAGPRGADFNMRWIASTVAEVHRILVRGGLFMHPRDTRDPALPGHPTLLCTANPLAMLVEQAGGGASTGRGRLLDIEPVDLQQRVPVILGSRDEVELLDQYHAAHDRGEPLAFTSPLFNTRSLFRTG